MTESEVEEQLRAARLEVDRAIPMLVVASPDLLDQCAGLLEIAGHRVAGVQLQLRGGAFGEYTGDAREEARRLRTSVTRASRLLEGAASLHLGWNRVRDTLCGGYMPCGHPAPPPARNRISVQG